MGVKLHLAFVIYETILFYLLHGSFYAGLFVYGRLIAPPTAHGHFGAFHLIKYYTS